MKYVVIEDANGHVSTVEKQELVKQIDESDLFQLPVALMLAVCQEIVAAGFEFNGEITQEEIAAFVGQSQKETDLLKQCYGMMKEGKTDEELMDELSVYLK